MSEESPQTAWFHEIIETNASNDFHETLISRWTYWKKAKVIHVNIGLGGKYYGG